MGTGAPTAKTKFDYAVTSRLDLISKYYDLSGKRVLDLGCGNGVYTAEIAKVADSVLGIEANERYYQDAIRLKEEEEDQEFRAQMLQDRGPQLHRKVRRGGDDRSFRAHPR